MPSTTDPPYGLLAEFETADQLVAAAEAAVRAGYRELEACSPFPIAALRPALKLPATWLPLVALAAGAASGGLGYGLQYWMNAVDYPLNVGGLPLQSWSLFLPVAFDIAILGAALATYAGMLLRTGLPRPHHPLFDSRLLPRASQDRFLLCVEADDPQFDAARTRQFLESLGARSVEAVTD